MKIKALDIRGIPYRVRTSKSKKRKITVSVKDDAVVNILYHPLMNSMVINEFVENHINWIEERYLEKYHPKREYKNNERYLFLGEEYILHVVEYAKNEVFIEGKYLVIHTKNNTYEYNKKLVLKFLKRQIEDVFNILLDKCFNNMKHLLKSYPKLAYRKYKSRWGCCYVHKNMIILNTSLIHVPLRLIECVIYHELTHLIQANHTKEFYRIFDLFVPNSKKVQKELRQFSTVYE